MNHSTQNHWAGGKYPNKGKGKSSQNVSGSLGNKNKSGQKGKGKAKEGLNISVTVDIPEMSTISSELINVSCYLTGEKVD